MQIENEFEVGAPPDTVFAFLLDVNRVAGCMPGAELSEVVDPTTFKGKVKIKVGPITVAYNGTARIVEKDDAQRLAKLEASGKETTGPGSANGTATMRVTDGTAGASIVKLSTEFTVAGRVANFGRGVMEDVSRRLVGQMAACIKQQLEGPAADAATAAPAATAPPVPEGSASAQETAMPAASAAPATASAETAGGASESVAPTPPAAAPASPTPSSPPRPAAPMAPAKPVNALSLIFSILWERILRLFGGGSR